MTVMMMVMGLRGRLSSPPKALRACSTALFQNLTGRDFEQARRTCASDIET
jgi:hypothetical protein